MDDATEKFGFKMMVSNLRQFFNEYREMKNELNDLKVNFSEFKTQKEDEINRLNNQKENDTSLITNLKEQIQALNKKLETKTKEMESSNSKKDSPILKNPNFQNVYYLRKRIESLRNVESENINEMQQLKKFNLSYSSDIAKARVDLNTQYHKINELMYSINSRNQVIEIKDKKIFDMYNEIQIWKAQFASLNQKFEYFEKENSYLKAENKSLKDENDSLQIYSNLENTELTKSLEELKILESMNKEFKDTKTSLEIEKDKITEQNKLMNANIQLKEKKIKEIDLVVIRLKKENGNLQSVIKKHVAELNAKKKEYECSLNDYRIEFEKVKQASKEFENTLITIENQKSLLEKKINQINQQMGFGIDFESVSSNNTNQYYKLVEVLLEYFVRHVDELFKELNTKNDVLTQYNNCLDAINLIKK